MCVCPSFGSAGLCASVKRHDRSFGFFAASSWVIVLNVLSWTQHTLSTVTRSLWPSVAGLPGLPYTVCPQAVAAIWFCNKSHSKVCPHFCTPWVSARTRLNFASLFKEIAMKIRFDLLQLKGFRSFSMLREICQGSFLFCFQLSPCLLKDNSVCSSLTSHNMSNFTNNPLLLNRAQVWDTSLSV